MNRILIILLILLQLNCVVKPTMTKNISFTGASFPYAEKIVILDNQLKIAFSDTGSGENTILFIHGLGSYSAAWKKNIERISADFRCIAIDLPGYGLSPYSENCNTLPEYAKVVQQFISTLKLKNVTIAGHSMGGQIAVMSVLENPNIFNKLVLLAPAGFEKFSEKDKKWFESIITKEAVKNTSPERTRFNFQVNFVNFPSDAQFMLDDRLKLSENPDFDNYCSLIPSCVLSMLDNPVFDSLSVMSIETLIIFGAEDKLIPNKFLHSNLSVQNIAESGSEQFKKGKLVIIPESGHFVQWEGYKIVNEQIKSFVKVKSVKTK